MSAIASESSVRVAVRIRPLIDCETRDACKICTVVSPNEPQICVGRENLFTYDYVFDLHTKQSQIYNDCVKKLVDGCFSGFNATVLAYGQTGSGKTYTMGTAQSQTDDESQGIIPRAVQQVFDDIEVYKRTAADKQQPIPEFKVSIQFLELYNEEIIDLMSESQGNGTSNKLIRINRENETVHVVGATIHNVTSSKEALECFKAGGMARTTAATKMNSESSRSHAIFTINLHRKTETPDTQDVETLSAKFHFVDLAGSERLKRTGATGQRAREGISINTGLLCLGNVISVLGDESRKASHVPYRDSKLTRLLQDSLGGNSQTVMIACISPSETDFMETLNTLRYANRARNIKNKVFCNQDSPGHTMALLRKEIKMLRMELSELKLGRRELGRVLTDEGSRMRKFHENRTEYLMAVKNQAKYELYNRRLRNEICELKRQKVIMMNRMREEANRHRIRDHQNSNRIAQLIKQERLKEVRIKNLEIENARLRTIIKTSFKQRKK